jgi:hypothetical protein
MYSKVKQLRTCGYRRHERDILSATAAEGDLAMVMVGGVQKLKLAKTNDSTGTPIIPILYDARLTTMHGNKMLFKGIERGSDGAEYVQEWSVQVGA